MKAEGRDPIPQGYPHREPVEIWEWRPVEGKPGYVEVARSKTYEEVLKEVASALPKDDLDKLDYFHTCFDVRGARTWPMPGDLLRLVVFPVTGGSEGHYIHVEVFDRDHKSECVYLAKTFEGWDWAWEFAKKLGGILGV
jgi:hypothetical protein